MGAIAVIAEIAAAATFALYKFYPEQLIKHSFVLSFLALFFGQFSLFAFYNLLIYPNFLDPLRPIPAAKGGSLLWGHGRELIKQQSGEPHRKWFQETPNDGLLRYYHFFKATRVTPISPQALKEIMVTKSYDFTKPRHVRKTISRVLGVGVLVAEGDEHKRQRKLLMPAFSFRHVKDLYNCFWEYSNVFTDCIRDHLNSLPPDENGEKLIEIGEWTSRVTLDIIGKAGCGHEFDSLHDPNNELSKAYKAIFETRGMTARVMQILSLYVPVWLLRKIPTKGELAIKSSVGKIRQTSAALVRQKREKMEKGAGRTDFDIISVALESGGFTDEQLVDQMMTFLAAGHETTSSALVWACYHLCNHPDVQKRLRDEIRTNLPAVRDPSTPLTATDIDHLPYLSAVLNEVLRISPSVPITMREAARDTTVLQYNIPKGTLVVLAPWAINTNKDLWGPDAHEFNPDRWMQPGTANTGGAPSNYAISTFLHGPRSCIGQQFSKAEAACIMAALFGRFEMSFPHDGYKFEAKGGLTIKPVNFKVNMKPVDSF